MGIKKTIKQAMKPFMGAFYAVGVLPKGMRYDVETLRVMMKYLQPEMNCVDVGANQGEILRDMLQFSPEGTHYAFEPIPDLAHQLQNDSPDNCKVYNLALSDQDGELSFNYVVSNPAYSGFKARSYDREEQAETITVRTARLDDIIPSDFTIHFVKIDVEGAEMQVLNGARQTLARCKPAVVFEHGLGGADVYGTTPQMIFDYFAGIGLRLSLLHNYLADRKPLTRDEFIRQFEQGINHYFIAHV